MSEQKSLAVPIAVVLGSQVGLAVLAFALFWPSARTVQADTIEIDVPSGWIFVEKGAGLKGFSLDGAGLMIGPEELSARGLSVEQIQAVALKAARSGGMPEGAIQDLREFSVNGYPGRSWVIENAATHVHVQVALIQTPGGIYGMDFAVPSDRWQRLRAQGLTILSSFRLRGDPAPAEDGRLVFGDLDAPSSEDLKADAYLAFHREVRNSSDPAARLKLLERWREQAFDAFDGAWRDLAESLGGGASNEALEDALLAEAARLKPPTKAIVQVLPVVRPRVRRGLLRPFRAAEGPEREAYLAALASSDDLNHPAILEAYLTLGVITGPRVARLIRAEGLDWTRDPYFAPQLHERARQTPGFVEALLSDESSKVTAFGCELVARLLEDEDPQARAFAREQIEALLTREDPTLRLFAAGKLEALLADEDPEVRAFAGRLVEGLLGAEDASLRVLACRRVEALPGEGDERLGKVLPLLRDPMSDVRAAAAEALQTLANPRASWGLARALARESDPYAQGRMLAALEASEPEATLNLILRLLRRKDVDDQRGAALALRAFSGEATLGGLQRALGSAEPAVVEAALESALALIERDGADPWTPCRAAVEAVDPAGPQGELRSQTLNALDRAG